MTTHEIYATTIGEMSDMLACNAIMNGAKPVCKPDTMSLADALRLY